MIIKNNTILLGSRKSSHGAGEFAGPGGHLEIGESIEACALRELAEEAGPDIKVKNMRFLCFINLKHYLPKHYAHIHMVAEWAAGEPVNTEPEVREGWDWYDINNLPQPLFGTTNQAIEAYQTGKNFFEA